MKLLVTGATGYIGARLSTLAEDSGHQVIAASRHPPAVAQRGWLPFDLSSAQPVTLPADIHAVIHLAADTSGLATSGSDDREVRAARSLIAAAGQAGAKFVFVSSQTARPDAPTQYARTKWLIEQEVLAAGGWIVRPGQVYGGPERGLFGKLVQLARTMPVLPVFLPSPKVQPIHIDDLARALLSIARRDDIPSGILRLGSPKPVSFSRFMITVAGVRARRRTIQIPVPSILARMFCKATSGTRLGDRLGVEQLKSLFGLPPMEVVEDIERLGLDLRSLTSGMQPSGNDRRRRLVAEGKAMLAYVLGEAPGHRLLRRYVRAVETLRSGCPLALPAWSIKLPATLALFDGRPDFPAPQAEEFAWRLDAATMLAEATPQGAGRFLGLGENHGPVAASITIAHALLAESLWRLSRALCSAIPGWPNLGRRQ